MAKIASPMLFGMLAWISGAVAVVRLELSPHIAVACGVSFPLTLRVCSKYTSSVKSVLVSVLLPFAVCGVVGMSLQWLSSLLFPARPSSSSISPPQETNDSRRDIPTAVAGDVDDGSSMNLDKIDSPTAADLPEWVELASTQFSIEPSAEKWVCQSVQITDDMTIIGFRASSPVGQVSVEAATTQMQGRIGVCSPDDQIGSPIYRAGRSTNDLIFPGDIKAFLKKGEYVNLRLHAFNPTDSALSAHAAVFGKPSATPRPTDDNLWIVNADRFTPPAAARFSVTVTCSSSELSEVFAIQPDTSSTGVHIRVRTGSIDPVIILDADVMFAETRNFALPRTVMAGGTVEFKCTFVSQGGALISSGSAVFNAQCLVVLFGANPVNARPDCRTSVSQE